MGRPSKDRLAIACALVAKAVYGFSTTRQLLEALERDAQLRRICGWKTARQVPHESTFSRAFEEFSQMQLPEFVHEALIRETQSDRLIGHIARDSTAIDQHQGAHRTQAAQRHRRNASGHGSRSRRVGQSVGARGRADGLQQLLDNPEG